MVIFIISLFLALFLSDIVAWSWDVVFLYSGPMFGLALLFGVL